MMPSWVRISILAAAVLLAAYSALYARQITEGPRDEGAQAARELYGQGALAAARMAALLGPVDAGLTAGADALRERPTQPLSAAEEAQRLAQGRSSLVSVVDGNGNPVANTGRGPPVELAFPPSAGTAVAAGPEGTLLRVRRVSEDRGLVAMVDPSVALSGVEGTGYVLMDRAGTILLARGVEVSGPVAAALSVDPERLTQAATSATVLAGAIGDQAVSVAAAEVEGADLMVLAVSDGAPVVSLASMLNSAWILAGPLAIGLGLTALLILQSRRAGRIQAETEQRFRMAVEAARCGVWEWDLNRDRVELSEQMAATRPPSASSKWPSASPILTGGPAGSRRAARPPARAWNTATNSWSAWLWTSPRSVSRRPGRWRPSAGCATPSTACRAPSSCSTATTG